MPKEGFKHTQETKDKMSKAHFGKSHSTSYVAEKHFRWKGDNVGYGALHDWVKDRLSKPELCVICNLVPPADLANISGEYKRDLDDWRYLCRKCHCEFDGRIIDMTGRQCSLCHSDKTYLNKNGRPDWRYHNGQLICKKCHHRIRRHII